MTGCTVAACSLALALTATGAVAAAQLAGSEWRPTAIGGIEVPADPGMFVRFGGDGKLAGNGGCNRFFGTYKLAGERIEIGKLGATRMACPEPVMERETRFLQALANARRFVRDRIDLSLIDEAGTPVIRLIQTDAD
jgi:heat shock protein HslJ